MLFRTGHPAGFPGPAGAVLLLLEYLETRGLVGLEPSVRDGLWRSQRTFGRASLALLHRSMDRRLGEGRPYGRWVDSRYNAEILWTTLLRPRPALLNLLALPASLVQAHWGPSARTPDP